MTNITPDVFTYENTNSEEEGQILTTSHAQPPQVQIPKLVRDCASIAHIVVRAEMLDDYVSSVPPTTVRWGTEGNIMLSHGVGTLRTRNHLPDGKVAETVFKNVVFVPEFGINILSVKMWLLRNRGALSCS